MAGWRAAGRRRQSGLLVGLLVVALLAGFFAASGSADAGPSAPTGTTFPPSTFPAPWNGAPFPTPTSPVRGDVVLPFDFARDMVVEPSIGRLFVSGGDVVVVLDYDGSLLATIPGLFGAAGLAISGDRLYVGLSTAGKIAEIDLGTLTVSREFVLGRPITGTSLAVINGFVWFVSEPTLFRMSTATGSTSARGDVGSSFQVVDSSTFLSPGSGRLWKYSVATNPLTWLGSAEIWGREAIDPTRRVFSDDLGRETDIGTMTPTGVARPWVSSDMWSPGFGGVFVGYGDALQLARSGEGTAAWSVGLGDRMQPYSNSFTSVAISRDATRLYALAHSTGWLGGVLRLRTFDTRPAVDAVAPNAVMSGTGDQITVSGRGLGGAVTATIGGVTATVIPKSTTTLQVVVPPGLQPGSRVLQLNAATGSVTTAVTIVPTSGATLSGTVTAGGPLPGIEIAVSGTGGGPTSTTTTGADGAYELTGLPGATDRVVTAHDPSGTYPDRVITGIDLRPGATTSLDILLTASQVAPGPILADLALPGEAKDLLFEPTTKRYFLTAGDEVLVVGADGAMVARVGDQWGADGLARDGTDIYVNQRAGGRIVRLSASSLQITGSWQTKSLTTGAIAFASGRVWYTPGLGVFSLNLASGSVADAGFLDTGTMDRLGPIDGSTSSFLGFNPYGYGVHRFDATNPAAVTLASAPYGFRGDAASAPLDRVWAIDGVERRLSDFTATGVTYPAAGWGVAYSDSRGGLLAFGSTLSRVGSPAKTHDLPVAPPLQAFGPAGDTMLYVKDSTATLYDLKPRLIEVDPGLVPTSRKGMTVKGSGLGATSAVIIDGTPTTFTVTDTGSLSVTLPTLGVGKHVVRAQTPWGNSNELVFTTVSPEPVVTSLTPATLYPTGGRVNITGTGFTGATGVTFAGVSAQFLQFSDSSITALVPAHPVASGPVVVTTPSGSNTISPTFAWALSPPVVTSLFPSSGPTDGGTWITITGQNFVNVASVTFGGVPAAQFGANNPNNLVVLVPPGAAGPAPVVVTTSAGQSSASGPTYTYSAQPRPVVTSVSPNVGPALGGTLVTITGDNFTGATEVRFGDQYFWANGVSPTVVNDETIEVMTPPGSVGALDVLVTAFGKTSLTSPGSTFTYVATVPPPPTALSATAADGEVLVRWVAPASGGSEILDYTATASPGGRTCMVDTGKTGCIIDGLDNGVAYTFTATARNSLGFGPASQPSNVVTPKSPTATLFTPLSPKRILDSRAQFQVGPYATPWGAGTSREVQVAGVGGVPADAESVVLNVTVTATTASSWLNIWPAGESKPPASSLNWQPGWTVPNAVTVKVGEGGKVRIANAQGSTHVVVDVVGYYRPDAGKGFTSLAPARILDSRAEFQVGPYTTPWGAGTSREVQVTGVGGVPAGADAVVVNMTVTETSAPSFLNVWPAGEPRTAASSLNWLPGWTIPNAVTVKVGAGGKINVANDAGSADVVVDVVGYFDEGSGLAFHSVSPARLQDSRAQFQMGPFSIPWGSPMTRNITVTDALGVPADAEAVLMNVTVTETSAPSWLSLWPAGGAVPIASNLNWAPGWTIPNAVTVKVGTAGKVSVSNAQGSTHVVADISGWYG